uniref:Uncharacterized protein n=1 Tax=Zea mays TaxID=4577 RepID=B6TY82_MAIZE|nr:hypothetical protein [Zea mays]
MASTRAICSRHTLESGKQGSNTSSSSPCAIIHRIQPTRVGACYSRQGNNDVGRYTGLSEEVVTRAAFG